MANLRLLLAFVLSTLSAIVLLRTNLLSRVLAPLSLSAMNGTQTSLPKTQAEWRKALDELPSTPEKIPAFFFGHGSPMLAMQDNAMGDVMKSSGINGPLGTFLKDFGPALLSKYKPKGIVVFSAHWESMGERLGASSLSHFSVN